MITLVDVEQFRKRLSKHYKISWELVINENRSTMLNLLDRKRGFAKISIHRMFLDAPDDVISAIAHHVRGTTRNKHCHDLLIRSYIQANLGRFNYAHLVDEARLDTKGRFYDLKAIYQRINKEYFEGALDLKITWFGGSGRKRRNRITYGQYLDHVKLVKIHRLLDDPFFPDYFLDYIVYHEMLHSVVRGYTDAGGRFRSHGPKYKKRERQFVSYDNALCWEKQNKRHYLNDGWT